MKYVASLILLLSSCIFAHELRFDTNKDVSLNTLRDFIPGGLIVQDDEVKRAYQQKKFFVNRYLNNNKLSDKDKGYLRNVLLNGIYSLALKDIFEKEKINITKDVSYSYYLANKDRFRVPDTIDVYVLTFKDKEDAKSYSLSDRNSSVSFSINRFESLNVDDLKPSFALSLFDLKENQLTDVIVRNKKYIRMYYNNKKVDSYFSYEDVKEDIEKLLFSKKKMKILDKIREGSK